MQRRVRPRRWIWRLAGGALLLPMLAPRAAVAHEGEPLAPHDVWQAWNWDPWIATLLLGAAVVYGLGVKRLWGAAGKGRGLRPWHAASFTGGLLALSVALISPLEAMAGVLFAAHMAQHLLLMLVAAPLLVLGKPELALLWALSPGRRRQLARWQEASRWQRVWSIVSKPAVVWLLYALGFWAWHAPALYQAALRVEAVHILEHATFLGTALLFWWTLRHCRLRGPGLSYGAAILLIFTTALHSGLLGWLLTFTTQLWYPLYGAGPTGWSMTPLQDQQLAGATMWAPAGLVYVVTALALLQRWLERQAAEQGNDDRHEADVGLAGQVARRRQADAR